MVTIWRKRERSSNCSSLTTTRRHTIEEKRNQGGNTGSICCQSDLQPLTPGGKIFTPCRLISQPLLREGWEISSCARYPTRRDAKCISNGFRYESVRQPSNYVGWSTAASDLVPRLLIKTRASSGTRALLWIFLYTPILCIRFLVEREMHARCVKNYFSSGLRGTWSLLRVNELSDVLFDRKSGY